VFATCMAQNRLFGYPDNHMIALRVKEVVMT